MLRKLALLDAAEVLDDLRVPPGNRLEKLPGERGGQHGIRVNDQGACAWAATRAALTTSRFSITTEETAMATRKLRIHSPWGSAPGGLPRAAEAFTISAGAGYLGSTLADQRDCPRQAGRVGGYRPPTRAVLRHVGVVWLNLQARFDLAQLRDVLGARLQEVRILERASQANKALQLTGPAMDARCAIYQASSQLSFGVRRMSTS